MSDPKAKFKKYVGAESGGGRPEGKGFITELQRQKLKPAHLEVIVTKNTMFEILVVLDSLSKYPLPLDPFSFFSILLVPCQKP